MRVHMMVYYDMAHIILIDSTVLKDSVKTRQPTRPRPTTLNSLNAHKPRDEDDFSPVIQEVRTEMVNLMSKAKGVMVRTDRGYQPAMFINSTQEYYNDYREYHSGVVYITDRSIIGLTPPYSISFITQAIRWGCDHRVTIDNGDLSWMSSISVINDTNGMLRYDTCTFIPGDGPTDTNASDTSLSSQQFLEAGVISNRMVLPILSLPAVKYSINYTVQLLEGEHVAKFGYTFIHNVDLPGGVITIYDSKGGSDRYIKGVKMSSMMAGDRCDIPMGPSNLVTSVTSVREDLDRGTSNREQSSLIDIDCKIYNKGDSIASVAAVYNVVGREVKRCKPEANKMVGSYLVWNVEVAPGDTVSTDIKVYVKRVDV